MHKIEAAIRERNLKAVKEILERDPSEIDKTSDDGTLMALLAAEYGDTDTVKYVVEYSRASMNIYDGMHRSILHYAVKSGNADVCRYLVEKVGMSPLEGDKNLETPFELAERLGFIRISKYFEKKVGVKLSAMYKNPVRKGFFPDPSVVRVGDSYYMVNSSFTYYPCIPVSHSKDLLHWEIIGYAVTNPEWCMLDGIESGRGFWAPDISYHDGRFYIAATFRFNDGGTVYRKQLVVSSDRPEGPYGKPAVFDEDGIDPSIFTDSDGRRYMLLNRGARIFELNADCTKQISEAEMLYYGDNKRAPEGPHLLKKDGYYYLFQAEGGTGYGHRISVSRSRHLKGEYEPCPYNPIMRQNDTGAAIQRCGHGKPVMTADGRWYMVYLCGRRLEGSNGEAYSILGRETALDPIEWTADGWPVVNGLKGPSCLQKKPVAVNFSAAAEPATSGRFDEKNLYATWLSVRVPERDGFGFSDGRITVMGSRYDLDDLRAKNILIRRQTHFDFDAECDMRVPELSDGQNCGLVCYYDENTFLKFAVFRREGSTCIGLIEKIGDTVRESGFVGIDPDTEKVTFKVITRGLKRTFYYSLNGGRFIESATADNVYYLCDEGLHKGKRFTGAMIGIYAFAGEQNRYGAEFGKFLYEDK